MLVKTRAILHEFFSALKNEVVEKRDLDLMYDQADNQLNNLVEDDRLTFQELQKLAA